MPSSEAQCICNHAGSGTNIQPFLCDQPEDRQNHRQDYRLGLFASSTFSEDDHRQFNRHGKAFDKGETFSGIGLEQGLKAVDELRVFVPEDASMAQFALRWILMHDAVTCTIPGAKTVEQAIDNAAASDPPELNEDTIAAVRARMKSLSTPWCIIVGNHEKAKDIAVP